MTTTTPEKFKIWMDDIQPGDVVQIKSRFKWFKKVVLQVDKTWIGFRDARFKKESLTHENFKPVMAPVHPVVKEFNRLPLEQQLIMRDSLSLAGIAGFSGNGETINEAFLRILKANKDASYKAKQVALNLFNSDTVELAMDLTIEARALYKKDKAWLDGIESEIERYFKPKGWIKEELNNSPFWKKSVHKDGIVSSTFVLHGIEAGTNEYVVVQADFEKGADNQIGEESVNQFKEFKELVEFIEVRK